MGSADSLGSVPSGDVRPAGGRDGVRVVRAAAVAGRRRGARRPRLEGRLPAARLAQVHHAQGIPAGADRSKYIRVSNLLKLCEHCFRGGRASYIYTPKRACAYSKKSSKL